MPGRSFAGPLPEMSALERDLAGRLKRHVVMLADTIGERHVRRPESLEEAAGYVENQFRSFGLTPASQTFVADGVTVRNIVADVRGSRKPDEILVVGGHYDSIPGCPAANDNASGVAATLELARLAAAGSSAGGPGGPPHREAADGGSAGPAENPFLRRPERTLRLVGFVNEEPPYFHTELMGSLVCARACKAAGEKLVGMVSLETIGCYSDEPGSQTLPLPPPLDRILPNVGNFLAFVGELGAISFVRRWVGEFRRLAKFPSEGVAAPGFLTGVDWSDHWSFGQVGCPALMITDTAPFRYPHYHTPRDTPDKLDYDRTARAVAGIARVTAAEIGAD